MEYNELYMLFDLHDKIKTQKRLIAEVEHRIGNHTTLFDFRNHLKSDRQDTTVELFREGEYEQLNNLVLEKLRLRLEQLEEILDGYQLLNADGTPLTTPQEPILD